MTNASFEKKQKDPKELLEAWHELEARFEAGRTASLRAVLEAIRDLDAFEAGLSEEEKQKLAEEKRKEREKWERYSREVGEMIRDWFRRES